MRDNVTEVRVVVVKRKTNLTPEFVMSLRASGQTLAKIGTTYGISRERVRQIEKGIRVAETLRVRQREEAYRRLDAINARDLHRGGARINFIARKAFVTWPMAKRYLDGFSATAIVEPVSRDEGPC
jgi:hypothetical protein